MKRIVLLMFIIPLFSGYFARITEARVLFPKNVQEFILDQKDAAEEEKFEKRFRRDLERGNREPETIGNSFPQRIMEQKIEEEEIFPLQLEFLFRIDIKKK